MLTMLSVKATLLFLFLPFLSSRSKFFHLGVDPNVGRGPGFDTRSGNILSFLLSLFQEGQLSVTGESMCTKYWLIA